MERTFVAIKPDAVQRGLIGEIIRKFEKKGFKIIGIKFMHIDEDTAQRHYGEHKEKPFFEKLVKFITSGPIVAMVIEGNNAIAAARKLMGKTDPKEADPGTIRADYAQTKERNIVHGSDSSESAKREISIFFNESEIIDNWHRDIHDWLYE